MQQLDDVIARKPAYDGGSIVNLIASMMAAAGAKPAYAPLTMLDPHELASARHLLLLVVDGLGHQLLRSVPQAAALNAGVRGAITSVYPPTTATAVTAFLTGLAPQQHGLTGWFMHFARLGAVITVLPFVTRLGRMPLASAGVEAAALFGHTPVFDTLPRRGFSVSPHDIAHSPFNRAHSGRAEIRPYRTLEDFFATLTEIARSSDETFTYAYWPHVDRLAHEHGAASAEVQAHVAEFDARFAGFLEAAAGTGTAVVAAADHGFIDVDSSHVIDMARHPVLKDMLLLPLCGEPRTAYCYVAPGREAEFEGYAREKLGHAAVCVPSIALLEHGLFGSGSPHPELESRIGSRTLLLRDGYAIVDRVPGEKPFQQRGVHGGGTLAELEVPLSMHLL